MQLHHLPTSVLAKSKRHQISRRAEESVLNYARDHNMKPLEVAASRDICRPCASKIAEAGAVPVSPLEK